MNPTRTVLLAGATGLVGGQMLQALLADPTVAQVHALTRRNLDLSHPKLRPLRVDFTHLPALPPADELYLALGTTIKVTGSQAAFRAVDFDAHLAVARAAVAAGVRWRWPWCARFRPRRVWWCWHRTHWPASASEDGDLSKGARARREMVRARRQSLAFGLKMCTVSPRASMATSCAMRRARVSGFTAVWMRHNTA